MAPHCPDLWWCKPSLLRNLSIGVSAVPLAFHALLSKLPFRSLPCKIQHPCLAPAMPLETLVWAYCLLPLASCTRFGAHVVDPRFKDVFHVQCFTASKVQAARCPFLSATQSRRALSPNQVSRCVRRRHRSSLWRWKTPHWVISC